MYFCLSQKKMFYWTILIILRRIQVTEVPVKAVFTTKKKNFFCDTSVFHPDFNLIVLLWNWMKVRH